jgi:PAS domain-containing protein
MHLIINDLLIFNLTEYYSWEYKHFYEVKKMDKQKDGFFLEDLSWSVYSKFFLDMAYKKKLLIAFLIISMGPLLTYSAVVYVFGFTLRTLPLFLVINLAVVYIASLMTTSNLLRPLHQLARRAKEIDVNAFTGELDVEVGKDEIGDVVESITKMGRAMSAAFETANSVITGLGEAMYVCDEDLVVTHINPAACELLGYTPMEILGKRCYAGGESTRPVTQTGVPLTKCLKEKKVSSGERSFLSPRPARRYPSA